MFDFIFRIMVGEIVLFKVNYECEGYYLFGGWYGVMVYEFGFQ